MVRPVPAGAARSARSDDDHARALSALAYRVHLKRAEFERAVNRFEEALALMGPRRTIGPPR